MDNNKAPDAFRTISEVADDLDVPQHVLRFWETRFREIKPMKRGGGRRYYRPEDVDLLRQIRSLLYDEGYTIKGAQKLLKTQRRGAPVDGEAGAEAAAVAVESRPRPGPELVPEVRHRLLELRAELAALRDALRQVVG